MEKKTSERKDGEETEKAVQEINENNSDSDSDDENDAASNRETVEKKNVTQKKDYMKKFRELNLKRNQARKLNHEEMVEEDRRNKLPANWEAKKRKAEWELADQEARKDAEEKGEDYEQSQLLQQSAYEIETLQWKKKKKNPDQGFSDFASAQQRQYQRLTKQFKPDMEEYSKLKDTLGEKAFPTAHAMHHGGEGKVSEAAIDRMVGDLDKQIKKREKYHRRRQHFDEANIDYINERNKKFNEKAERYYGKYTEEIKQNLERGTAI